MLGVVIAGFLVLLVSALAFKLASVLARERAQSAERLAHLRDAQTKLRELGNAYRALSAPLLWARWWARNGAENPVQSERAELQRLAIAALCAESVETLREALQRAPGQLAALAIGEIDAKVLPWEWLARCRPDHPPHVPELLAEEIRRVLTEGFVPRGGQSNSGFAPTVAEKT